MTVELHITFKDPDRERVQQPFLFHSTLIDTWLPLAEQLGLPMLERTGVLMLDKEDEARRLLAELRTVQQFIRRTRKQLGPDRMWLFRRLTKVIRFVEDAVADWDGVAGISL
jgi:hypothetical protein